MNPTILAWALALPITDRWRSLAEAYAAGTVRVTFEGRTVEYRSLQEIAQALTAGYGAANAAAPRPPVTVVQFSRSGW
jgi:hypothetical protein